MEAQEEQKINEPRSDGIMSAPPKISVEDYKSGELSEPPTPETITPKEIVLYNKRALTRYDTTYKLENFEKNFLLVFNQQYVDGYKPRYGTKKDVKEIEKTFSRFGFEVHVRDDFTKDQILEEIKIFKEKDFTDYGCVAIIVLTHGSYEGFLRAKDQEYNESELINQFKTHDKPTLITKPKILIIQACRGKKISPAVLALKEGQIRKDVDDEHGFYSLPLESDILVFHSSYIGSPSYRDVKKGSWFIQTLCQEINRLSPNVDIESIMTEVRRAVAIDMETLTYNRATTEIEINKQMPIICSTLLRKLYFKQYIPCDTHVSLSDSNVAPCTSETLEPNSTPIETSLTLSNGQCLCFLSHFNYLREVLRDFVENNRDDEVASTYLDLCETLKDVPEFNTIKETMIRVISLHLSKNVPTCDSKYLYLYKNK